MLSEVFLPFTYWEWWLYLSLLFAALWVLHLRIRNASLADVGFCFAFVVLVLICGIFSAGDVSRRILIAGMGIIYGVRLGHHLFKNRTWNRPEDPRYQKIRCLLGSWESVGIFFYFQFQVPAVLLFAGLLCWVMKRPVVVFRWWDALGLFIFLVAVLGEGVADRQLEIFRQNPLNKGKTLQAGLWRYSRHPNYFFESLHWWAYVPFAVGLPWAWVSIFWPILMMMSLLWLTGVPWAEAQAPPPPPPPQISRGEGYREYQRTTNMFFPWFPRKLGSGE